MPKVEMTGRGIGQGLSQLEERRPELLAWLQPLRVALSTLSTDLWQNLVPLCSDTRSPNDPALHQAVLPTNGAQLNTHVRSVLQAALGSHTRTAAHSVDGDALLKLIIAHDHAGISAIASERNLDADRLAAAAQLAALPLLITCARVIAPNARSDWAERYCHVCGALPALAEVVGLERARHLRCARCGAGWQTHVLLCPFCDERDHARLGSLTPDGVEGQVCWVETCETCRSYIKARAALRGAALDMVLIEDASTLELDLVAAERGYRKPEHGEFATEVHFTFRSNTVS